jgi:hypothetical protein
LIQKWIKEPIEYKDYPLDKEFTSLEVGIKQDVKHTLLRNIWKGKDMAHCDELVKVLELDLFKGEDNKRSSTFEILLRRRFVQEKVNVITILKKVYEKYVPDEKELSEDALIKSFISKVSQSKFDSMFFTHYRARFTFDDSLKTLSKYVDRNSKDVRRFYFNMSQRRYKHKD